MKKVSCHRNLNLAKRNPRKFVWILGKSPNKNGDFAPTTKPKKIAEVHDGAFMLKNAVLHVNMTGARKINSGVKYAPMLAVSLFLTYRPALTDGVSQST